MKNGKHGSPRPAGSSGGSSFFKEPTKKNQDGLGKSISIKRKPSA